MAEDSQSGDDREFVDAMMAVCRERNGRLTLTCAQAFALAREHGVALSAVGRACNEHHIKITACQLGCFK